MFRKSILDPSSPPPEAARLSISLTRSRASFQCSPTAIAELETTKSRGREGPFCPTWQIPADLREPRRLPSKSSDARDWSPIFSIEPASPDDVEPSGPTLVISLWPAAGRCILLPRGGSPTLVSAGDGQTGSIPHPSFAAQPVMSTFEGGENRNGLLPAPLPGRTRFWRASGARCCAESRRESVRRRRSCPEHRQKLPGTCISG